MAFPDAWLQPGHLIFCAVAALLGLPIGSFLNVVIHRLPVMMARADANAIAEERGEPLPHPDRYDLLLPRSACPHCATPLAPMHLIPVLGWLALRGRCGNCRAPIGLRYPAVELLTALVFGLAAWRFGAGLAGWAAMTCGAMLIALAVIDARTMLLPDALTLPLLWLGLLLNLEPLFAPLPDAVLGAALGYGVLWLVYWLFRLMTGKEGVGHGDFKLFAALGAWLGWQCLPAVLLGAAVLGAAVGLAGVVSGRHGRDQPIPFGPYLAIAGMLALLFKDDLPAWPPLFWPAF